MNRENKIKLLIINGLSGREGGILPYPDFCKPLILKEIALNTHEYRRFCALCPALSALSALSAQ